MEPGARTLPSLLSSVQLSSQLGWWNADAVPVAAVIMRTEGGAPVICLPHVVTAKEAHIRHDFT